jgi:hypothetical protein
VSRRRRDLSRSEVRSRTEPVGCAGSGRETSRLRAAFGDAFEQRPQLQGFTLVERSE